MNQRIEESRVKRLAILKKLRSLSPEIEIISDNYGDRFQYYTASVTKSEIKIEKQTRMIYMNDKPEGLIKDRFLTEKGAKEAILKVMPLAKEKYRTCLNLYNNLKKEQQFSVGYNYDGDTYGIYNEYSYISFNLNGFDFQFEMES